MLRERIAGTLENHAPRKSGMIAVNLRIKEISKPDASACETNDYHQPVRYPPEIESLLPSILFSIPQQTYQDAYGSPVTGQSALPRLKHLQKALCAPEIILRVIENTMPKSRTYHHTYKHSIEKRVQISLIDALAPIETTEDIVTENKA